jgi:hypothetical protein
LGKVVRLALSIGTELVSSPVRHPQSNGTVERFHQDYNRHVWENTELQGISAVQAQADRFFDAYRHSRHHSALGGRSPTQIHAASNRRRLSPTFTPPKRKLPLTEGDVHFMRLVSAEKTISVLNLTWDVPAAESDQGVWATLELRTTGATLRVFDQAPDACERRCLAEHPSPLKEDVHPFQVKFPPPSPLWAELLSAAISRLVWACELLYAMV